MLKMVVGVIASMNGAMQSPGAFQCRRHYRLLRRLRIPSIRISVARRSFAFCRRARTPTAARRSPSQHIWLGPHRRIVCQALRRGLVPALVVISRARHHGGVRAIHNNDGGVP